jgi:2-(1,2-epoxy-1,2-dihydrophenyl)acetyl-CoA isomerase
MENYVLLKKTGGIAEVVMNRPETLNSLHPLLVKGLISTLRDLDGDNEIRVVILTGAGKGFCSGGDLSSLEKVEGALAARKYVADAGGIVSTIVNMKKPVIAMVNGAAAGAGFNVALACDIVFCAGSAKFIQSFANIALVPDCGGMYFLPKTVGLHRAKELMFTAEVVTSELALELGLVNRVFDKEELREKTYEYAEKLVQAAPVALSYVKKVLNQSHHLDLEQILEKEADLQALCLLTEDNKEGIKAFKEKRKPEFKGR